MDVEAANADPEKGVGTKAEKLKESSKKEVAEQTVEDVEDAGNTQRSYEMQVAL